MEDPSGNNNGGMASSFLNSKGFGWMLETSYDENDEDLQLPLLEELDIDVADILRKLRLVMVPCRAKMENNGPHLGGDVPPTSAEDADFWGPLFVVLFYSTISVYGQFSVVSWILTIWLLGSLMIFVLSRVLCGEVSYSQCIGVIGYSLLPLALMSLLTSFISYYWLSLVVKLIGALWSTYSASRLLCVNELARKSTMLIYPMFLLYSYFLSIYSGV